MIISPGNLRFITVGFGLLILVAVLIVCYNVSSVPDTENSNLPNSSRAVSTLKFLAVISRHGNRSPKYSYPNDPYNQTDLKYWPNGLKDLTSIGRYQMYKLGERLRYMYNGFLKPNYYAGDLYATSTLLNRTILSALSLLAGLYPPQGYQVWNKNIPWQPIPLYTDSPDKSVDYGNCPRFIKDQKRAFEEYQEQYASNISAINAIIGSHAGLNITTAQQVFGVWDSFFCEDLEGYPLPEWAKPVYPEPLTSVVAEDFIPGFAKTDSMVRILMGTFIDNLFEIIQRKINGTLSPGSQIHYFSGHDSSLVPLQVALGISPENMFKIVRPASAMVFELHQNHSSDSYFIQVLYIDGLTTAPPTVFSLPGCGMSCDLDHLMNISQRFRNVNYNDECQLNNTVY